MPQPPAGQDWYMIVPLMGTGQVMGAAQVMVVSGTSEENAIAKAPTPAATAYAAIVMPTFDPPPGYPKLPVTP